MKTCIAATGGELVLINDELKENRMDLKAARATLLEEWHGIKGTTARVLLLIGARHGIASSWDRARFGNGRRRTSKSRRGGNSVGLAMRRQSPNRAAALQRGSRTVWPGMLLLLFTGCGSPPDVRDPETLGRILAEAADLDVLQERGNYSIVYAPNESEPYSGWAKRMHEVDVGLVDVPSPQVAELVRFDAGRASSRFQWYENGQMGSEAYYEAGEPAGRWTLWYSDGEKEIEFDHDTYSLIGGVRSVDSLPLTSSGPLTTDIQFVFEATPGCTRVEVGNRHPHRSSYYTATLNSLWTGVLVARLVLYGGGSSRSQDSFTINETSRQHYRLRLNVVPTPMFALVGIPTPDYELEVAATECDD